MLIPEGREAPNPPQRGAWPQGNTTVALIPAVPNLLGLGGSLLGGTRWPDPKSPLCLSSFPWELQGRGQILHPARPNQLHSVGIWEQKMLQNPHPEPQPDPLEPPRAIPSAQDEATTVHEDFYWVSYVQSRGGGRRSGMGGLPKPWLRAGGACPAAAAAAAAGLPSA